MEVPQEVLQPTIALDSGDRARQHQINAILHELHAETEKGRKVNASDRLHALGKLIALRAIPTLEPFLPGLLNLNGKPYQLRDHFPFSSLFSTFLPEKSVYQTGRQTSKSTSQAASGILLCNAIPNYKILFVTPLYEQIRRFSNNYVRTFINQSPVRSRWTGTSTENSVLQRSFKNQSLMIFSFALLDADRIRGIAADQCSIDEIQDLDPAHLPVIMETMSASPWGTVRFTGTPKTKDGPLYGLYNSSSMAEWFIPCRNCREQNIPSLEYHLMDMLGPYHSGISERSPGVVCHKCRKPINPRWGHWVHRKPELRWLYPGYHIPQVLLPLHYASPKKWSELVRKQSGWGNTTQAQFLNEVLGESVDVGQKLVTESELKAASTLPWKNNWKQPADEMLRRLNKYHRRCLAIDWGGGGEDGVSFTTLALLGYDGNGGIDVLWGKRLLTSNDHLEESKEVIHWFKRFNCDLMAHDYTGAGALREPIMMQAGFSLDKILAVRLVAATRQDMMVWHEPTIMNNRGYHSLDKTRSLLYTCQAIKLKSVKFFEYDWQDRDNVGLIYDFLSLTENKVATRLGGDIYSITKNILLLDDFAQAVNIGCAGLWHATASWPNFAEIAGLKLTSSAELAAITDDRGWDASEIEENFGPGGYDY